jgi:outer membrane lipoprotein-sorting protein/peroxiredoxin
MKSRTFLLTIICALALAIVISGCGNKNSSVKSANRHESRAASKNTNSTDKSAESTDAQSQATNGRTQGPSGSSLPLGNQPSTLDQALNPLAGLGQNTKSGSGTPDSFSLPTTAAPTQSAPAALPESVRPKPEQLLGLVQMRYRSIKTIRTVGASTSTVIADGKVVNRASDNKSGFSFKRPDKFNFTGSTEQLVSNGKVVVRYLNATKRYAKTKLDKKSESLLLRELIGSQQGVRSLGLLLGVDYSSAMSSMKLLKDAKVGGRDTFVLSMHLKQGVAGPKGTSIVQTLWIGKKDFVIYRNQLIAKGKPQMPKGFKDKVPKSVETIADVVSKKCVLDANIPDSNFVFNAPSGAKPIEDLTKDYLHAKHAPEIAFTWTDGTKKSLDDFQGKPVILDCWALPMCAEHLPVLQKIYEKHKNEAQIVSICVNSEPEKVKKYLSEKSLDFPVVYANKEIANVLRTKYHVQVLPTIFLIDKSGVVQETMLGIPPEKDIVAKLNKIQ